MGQRKRAGQNRKRLGGLAVIAYSLPVLGFLRFIAITNAAVWFGASVFFTFGVGPAFFSADMKALLGEQAYPVYSGAVALIVIERFFLLQNICGAVALVHLFAEWLYAGRPLSRLNLGLLGVLFALGLLGGLGLQPHMKALHRVKYAVQSTAAERETAAHAFRLWHGVSQAANLGVMAAILFHLVQVSQPGSVPLRYGGNPKFRG